jgi:hypothetical protein
MPSVEAPTGPGQRLVNGWHVEFGGNAAVALQLNPGLQRDNWRRKVIEAVFSYFSSFAGSRGDYAMHSPVF